MHSDFPSGDRLGFGQQGQGSWPSLDGSQFSASWTIAHVLWRDQDKQRAALIVTPGAAALAIPGDP
jgi:hypothetical protein